VTYTTTHEVRYSDIDRFGHINHLRLLEFFESARNPFFREMAEYERLPNVVDIAGFVVVHINATFHQAVDADAVTVEVRTSVERLGESSVTMRYELWYAAAQCLSASTVLVFLANSRPQPMSAARREFLSSHRAAQPEGATMST
jgi:acyl-CoA thioester hydrolase